VLGAARLSAGLPQGARVRARLQGGLQQVAHPGGWAALAACPGLVCGGRPVERCHLVPCARTETHTHAPRTRAGAPAAG
jgi:hypothetical protein